MNHLFKNKVILNIIVTLFQVEPFAKTSLFFRDLHTIYFLQTLFTGFYCICCYCIVNRKNPILRLQKDHHSLLKVLRQNATKKGIKHHHLLT